MNEYTTPSELFAECDDWKARAEKAEAELAEIGNIAEFQDQVRALVIKLSGAPDNAIDGKGSDAGWEEFTLAEISQGFAFLKEQLDTHHCMFCQRSPLEDSTIVLTRVNPLGITPAVWCCQHCPNPATDLARVQAQAAVMREALVQSALAPLSVTTQQLRGASLSSDAGRDFIDREKVKPLVEALAFIRSNQLRSPGTTLAKVDEALSIARELGLGKESNL